MSFTNVNTGDTVQAEDVNAIYDALEGVSGEGQPISLTALNDATNYALRVSNLDTTNGRILLLEKADGTDVMRVTQDGLVAAIMGLGSDATGDIYYRAATTGLLARLAIGSAGGILRTRGGLPAWESPGVGFASATSTVTTTSATYVDLDTMSTSVTTRGGALWVFAMNQMEHNAASATITVAVSLDAAAEVGDQIQRYTNNEERSIPIIWRFSSVSAAAHTVKTRWKTSGATAEAQGRSLLVIEE